MAKDVLIRLFEDSQSPGTCRGCGGGDRLVRDVSEESPHAGAAKLAAREFLDLDDAAITAYVKAQRSSARIAGIEVFEEKV